jgi:hypothetical protein
MLKITERWVHRYRTCTVLSKKKCNPFVPDPPNLQYCSSEYLRLARYFTGLGSYVTFFTVPGTLESF